MYIKKIKIENFRSIDKVELDVTSINIFYGLNDVGKSNVLKALNLFFNDVTEHNLPYDFHRDFCQYTLQKIKKSHKAPEIKIELVLSYYVNKKEFTWQKIWRDFGLYKDEVSPILQVDNGNKIEKRSRHETWARNLIYRYVPAMKDNAYFSELLKEFYNVFSISISEQLEKTFLSFVKMIDDNTISLSDNLKKSLGIDTKISLPSDLAEIFSKLDFKTKNKKQNYISLNNRGDGLKIRHVPIILKFFSEQQKNKQGSIKSNTIWGYEEPENNLELKAAFEKSEEFLEYSENIQILLTTHSPAFYSLKKHDCVKLYNTVGPTEYHKGDDESEVSGTRYILCESVNDVYNIDQGFLTLISPIIENKIEEVNTAKETIKALESKDVFNNNVVFVEGKTDKIILEHLFREKYSHLNIVVIDSGGCNQTKNNLISWLYNPYIEGEEHKYYALALFDNDNSGNKCFMELESHKKTFKAKKSTKGMNKVLKVPKHLSNIKRILKENYSIEIEELFPYQVWDYAKKQGWLIKQEKTKLSRGLITDENMTSNEFFHKNFQNEEELLFVEYKVDDKYKLDFAKYVLTQEIEIFNDIEINLKDFLDKISKSI